MLTAAVVGLGSIGQLYDYDNMDGTRVLTHANGFFRHAQFELVAGVDPSEKNRAMFQKKFLRSAYSSVAELYEHCSPDVVSIAVPTHLHHQVFCEIVSRKPKAILCEKPVAATLDEGRQMQKLANQYGVTVLINYIRRFEPGVLDIKRRIQAGEIGAVYKGVMWYSKGILNNGSHFIDLLIYLLGSVGHIAVLDPGDTFEGDPEPDVQIVFGQTCVYFLSGRERCFSVKELELIGTKGSLKYLRGGELFEFRHAGVNPLFPGYNAVLQDADIKRTELTQYQTHVLDDLAAAVTSKRLPLSNMNSALETLSVIERIKKLL